MINKEYTSISHDIRAMIIFADVLLIRTATDFYFISDDSFGIMMASKPRGLA